MESLERIEAAFVTYCATGEVTLLNRTDIGYLKHCLILAARVSGDTSGHPLFARWALEGNGDKVDSFLTESKKLFDAKGKHG